MSQWVVFFGVSGLLVVAGETGYRFGRRLHRTKDEPRKAQIDGIQGAVLGMLGLLLAFAFSMALSRFDIRRQLVIEEANAIGTTYLRASFLPEADRNAVQSLLHQYVDERIAFYTVGSDFEKLAEVEERAAVLQGQLWVYVVKAAKMSPNNITATFIETANKTIDLDASRLAALDAHIPATVWILLLVVAIAGCYTSGYRAGASGVRTVLTGILLPLLVAVIITLISDLSRSRYGLIGTNQTPLFNLQKSIQAQTIKSES